MPAIIAVMVGCPLDLRRRTSPGSAYGLTTWLLADVAGALGLGEGEDAETAAFARGVVAASKSRRETAPYNAQVVGISAKEEARKEEAPSTIRSKVGTGGCQLGRMTRSR